jgi:hypothetical protein
MDADDVAVFAFCLGRLEDGLEKDLLKAERGGIAAIGRCARTEATRRGLAQYVAEHGAIDPRDPDVVWRNTSRFTALATHDAYQRAKNFHDPHRPGQFERLAWIVSQRQQFSVLNVPEDHAHRIWRVAVCDWLTGDVDDLLADLDGLVPGVEAEALLETGNHLLMQIGHLTAFDSQRGQVDFTPSMYYEFSGPIDRGLRPFCRHLLGRIHTGDEIAAMRNPHGMEVFWTGGGWGCRHRWLPVTQFSDAIERHGTGTRDPWVEDQLRGLDGLKPTP